jgi:hypothetical protein
MMKVEFGPLVGLTHKLKIPSVHAFGTQLMTTSEHSADAQKK